MASFRLRVRTLLICLVALLLLSHRWQNQAVKLLLLDSSIDLASFDVGLPNTLWPSESSSCQRNNSQIAFKFHLIHTTSEESFGLKNLRSIESVFFHHPGAEVIVHARNMSSTPFQYLIDAGHNVRVEAYNPRDEVHRLIGREGFDQASMQTFVNNIDMYAGDTSGFWYSNESNLLRLILMYLDGGIYLDADVIVTRPFYDLPKNTLGRQDDNTVNGAVLYFDPYHSFIEACLQEFFESFNNNRWGVNGPGLLTRVLDSYPIEGNDLHVANSSTFYFFHYKYILKDCFQDTRQEKVMKRLARIQENSYAVHLNNQLNGTAQAGTVCSCLLNAFCMGHECEHEQRCLPLVEGFNAVKEAFTSNISENLAKMGGGSLSQASPFHLIHTTDDQTFGEMQRRSIESIFFHHPNATVLLHAKNMTEKPVQYLMDAGFDIRVNFYDSKARLQELKALNIIPSALIDRFTAKIDDYSADANGNWFSNESNLMRMIFLYLEGGIYMDTDTIVVRPLDSLPSNALGYQDAEKTRLNGAVMKFRPGHPFIRGCLHEFLRRFNNRIWGANGPRLLTRVFQTGWDDLAALPSSYFQFFDWRYIQDDCYVDTREEKVMNRLDLISQQSYVVHLNNHLGANLTEGSPCHCLLTSFCIASNCQPSERCKALQGISTEAKN